MTKVTVHNTAETPAEGIVKAARKQMEVTDALGRKIVLRRLSPLDRMRLAKCVKPENSKNEGYMLYAMIAFSVTSIDDEDAVPPQNELHLEAMIQRLDDAGFEAVLAVLPEFYPDTNADEVIAAAKK